MADTNIIPCTQCLKCADKNECVDDDDFKSVRDRLIEADAIFLIAPVYALIPAKLTALLEKLTVTGHLNNSTPFLLGKKVGIFVYCSCFICQDDDLKRIFRKFVVEDELDETKNHYRYLTDDFMYIENSARSDNPYAKLGPDNIFNHDIVEYVKSVALWLT